MPKESPAPVSTRDQIAELERQIHGLRSEAARELKEKITQAKAVVASLEKELAGLTGHEAPVVEKQKRTRQASIPDEELHAKILNVLAYKPTGVSAKAIADEIDVNYPRVAKYIVAALSKNSKAFRLTGSGAGRKYFLP